MRRALGAALALALFLGVADARDRNARADFQRQHPCPATGKTRGPCPGYVVDHFRALCAGGEDAPHNMQWQTVEEAKVKDAEERRECAALRRR